MTHDIQLPVPLCPGTFLTFLELLLSQKDAPWKSKGIRAQVFLPLPTILVTMSLAYHGHDHKTAASPGMTMSLGCRKIRGNRSWALCTNLKRFPPSLSFSSSPYSFSFFFTSVFLHICYVISFHLIHSQCVKLYWSGWPTNIELWIICDSFNTKYLFVFLLYIFVLCLIIIQLTYISAISSHARIAKRDKFMVNLQLFCH